MSNGGNVGWLLHGTTELQTCAEAAPPSLPPEIIINLSELCLESK